MPLRPYLYSGPEPAVIDPNVYPRSSDDSAPKQAHPWNPESTFQVSRGAYNPVQSEHATEQVLSFPRGQPVSNSESNFEEVKHVAPTRPETPSQSEFMIWERQGHTKPLQFVYNEHDLVFDKSVPNRHAMSLTGLPLPQSRGRGTYQRGLTRNGSGFGREVPVLGSTYLTNHPDTRAMERRGPVFVPWERPPIGFPAHRARLLHRNNNVKQSVQGDLFPRLALKPVPVRISPWT